MGDLFVVVRSGKPCCEFSDTFRVECWSGGEGREGYNCRSYSLAAGSSEHLVRH